MGYLGPNADGIKGIVSSWAGGYTKELCEAVLDAAKESASKKRSKEVVPTDHGEDLERDAAGNGRGEPSLSLPELSLPSLPNLQEGDAGGSQATVCQVRTCGVDMC